ncbi:MAG: HD domain-containing protein [Alphaproteobacteria bacterium]
MDIKQALSLVQQEKEFSLTNGRPKNTWYMYHNHIYGVAEVAKEIASRTTGLDTSKAYLMGLLHDIGKLREDVFKRHHGIVGYEMLKDIDKDIAGICITHMFGTNSNPKMDKKFFDNVDDYNFISTYLKTNKLSEYDKLIQCCDMLSDARGFVTIEQRAKDYETRHGIKLPENALAPRIKLKEYFDDKIGVNIYSLYPLLNQRKLFINNGAER